VVETVSLDLRGSTTPLLAPGAVAADGLETGASAGEPLKNSDEIAERTRARSMAERKIGTEWGAWLTQNSDEDNGEVRVSLAS